ncbi:response regulator [Aromatoleum diolicum]|uniref:Response regulator n=1 Tax=Aromatoleum diolicum TaxID=75796 RepID=A0ABX1QC59_9RHOO|nr:response regulator [Aromatoleum diolicum]NMG74680.1 response regulator [Aromatoleum diolicum]
MASRRSVPRLRIVVVEDSPLLRELLCDMLAQLDGVEVVAAAAGEAAALRALQEQPSDLVIVDLQLESGSGLGVLRALRREPARYGQPIAVVFSNYGHVQLRERCRALGVAHFFDKALQMDELIDFVEAARKGVVGDH